MVSTKNQMLKRNFPMNIVILFKSLVKGLIESEQKFNALNENIYI